MSNRHDTSDVWLAGFFQAETDARLVDVQVNRNGRTSVVFSFEGEDLSKAARAYCNGKAVANVVQLRAKINEFRDIIFQARKT